MTCKTRFLAFFAMLAFSSVASACPFCSVQGQTLAGEVAQADMIILGVLKNAQRDPNDLSKGTTELHVESIVKEHPYASGKKVLILPRYIQLDSSNATAKMMVFFNLYNSTIDTASAAAVSPIVLANLDRYQLDPYRGDELEKGSLLPEYLKGAAAVREKDPVTRLVYFFDFLDSPESKISTDAFLEYANADYKDVQESSLKVDLNKVLTWLKNPNTPASRFGLFGLMVGHAKKKEFAASLRDLLDDPKKHYSSGLDGVIAGYILLDPIKGWEFLLEQLRNEKNDFQVRYAGLRVLRFFWESRPDVIEKKKIVEGMKILIAQSDIADLPIEDLRKWDQHDAAEYIIEFGQKESHSQIPIVRRAVLRYALTVEAKCEPAKKYINLMETQDPERVKMVREMLADERPKTPAK